MLGELERAHLIEERTPGRFTFHDLLRAYATEQTHTVDTDIEQRAAVHRTLDHYLHTAHTAALLLNPHRDPLTLAPPQPGVRAEKLADQGQALAWFSAEHPVLLAAIVQAAATGFDTHTWQLPWTLAHFFDLWGHWHNLAVTGYTALAAAQYLTADRHGQVYARLGLGFACAQLGRYDDAHTHLRHALDLFGEFGDRIGQARTHLILARVLERQDHPGEALTHVRQALDLYRAAGHQFGQATALTAVGWDHALLGDYQQALIYCQQALTLQQELGNRHSEAVTWDSIGYIRHRLGHHVQATTCYQQAIDLYRELGHRYNEAVTLTHLGDTHHATGDPDTARDTWQQALDIFDQLGHPEADQVRAKLHRLDAS